MIGGYIRRRRTTRRGPLLLPAKSLWVQMMVRNRRPVLVRKERRIGRRAFFATSTGTTTAAARTRRNDPHRHPAVLLEQVRGPELLMVMIKVVQMSRRKVRIIMRVERMGRHESSAATASRTRTCSSSSPSPLIMLAISRRRRRLGGCGLRRLDSRQPWEPARDVRNMRHVPRIGMLIDHREPVVGPVVVAAVPLVRWLDPIGFLNGLSRYSISLPTLKKISKKERLRSAPRAPA
jgi:hypothetical protein